MLREREELPPTLSHCHRSPPMLFELWCILSCVSIVWWARHASKRDILDFLIFTFVVHLVIYLVDYLFWDFFHPAFHLTIVD